MGVAVGVEICVAVRAGTGVLANVGEGRKVGVGVAVGETVGVVVTSGTVLRVAVRVGVELGTTTTLKRVSVTVGVGVPVGGVVHQGAVNEKPSSTQVRLPPPLQVVWNISNWRPGWNTVPCPRSKGGGENRFPVPIGIETAKLFGL